jgi:hypothetical protein
MATIRNYFIIVTTLAVAGAAGVMSGLTASLPPVTTSAITTTTTTTTTTSPAPPPSNSFGGVATTNPDTGCSLAGNPISFGFRFSNDPASFATAFNFYRSNVGLSTLNQPPPEPGCNSTLCSIYVSKTGGFFNLAGSRLADMIQNNYVGVVNTSGQDIATEMAADGIPFKNAGLIVFQGCLFGVPVVYDNAIDAWLANPASSVVMQNPNWTDYQYAIQAVNTGKTGGNGGNGTGYYLIVVVFRQAP